MAEELRDQVLNEEAGEGEVKDRGLFDFVHKKKAEEGETPQKEEEEVLVTGVEKIHIEDEYKSEGKKEEKKHGLLDKLHRSHSSSSSSSSSDEEEVEGEGGIKEKIRKKKKDLKDKLHGGEKKKEEEKKEQPFVPAAVDDTPAVLVEKVEVFEEAAPPPEQEKKGFLDKIKEKLPGHGKKAVEEGAVPPPPPPPAAVEVPAEHVKEQEAVEGAEGKEKKGFLGKIMEKLPGYHKNTGEEAEKSPGAH